MAVFGIAFPTAQLAAGQQSPRKQRCRRRSLISSIVKRSGSGPLEAEHLLPDEPKRPFPVSGPVPSVKCLRRWSPSTGFQSRSASQVPSRGPLSSCSGPRTTDRRAYDAVCQRLHTASLRTVVISPDRRLTPKSVVGILDSLGVKWALLVGDRVGGEIAWELAASRLDRFIGLVVIDRGHPRVADMTGVVRDEDCPPVEINTTALVSTPAARAVAKASQRYVYGDYRWSSCWDGATHRSPPHSWPPRSCCAPAPGMSLVMSAFRESTPAGGAGCPGTGSR